MTFADSGSLGVNFGNEIMVINFFFKVVLSLPNRVHSSEIARAPHLVSVEFIRASEFVSIFLGFCACVKGISGLKAQFLIPTILGSVVITQKGKLMIFGHVRHFGN